MSNTDTVFDTLRELVTAANPGFVRKVDLERLEEQLDELDDLVSDIEARLDERDTEAP